MTPNEFDIEIIPLKKRWGANAFPEELTTRIYDRIKFVTREQLRDAVNNIIACERYSPLLPKFEEALGEALSDAKRRFREGLIVGMACNVCQNTGRISVDSKRPGIAPTCYRCDCKIGATFYYNFTPYRSSPVEKQENQIKQEYKKSKPPPANTNFKPIDTMF